MHRFDLPLAVASASLVLAACGASPPLVKDVEPEAPRSRPRTEALHIRSEVGSIDEAATNKTLNGLEGSFAQCQNQRLGAVATLSGKGQLYIRVGEDGKAKYAYFEDSDIGDRDTEKCVVDAVMAAQFPKAEDGEAIVRYPIELSQHADRAPDAWDPSKVSKAAQEVGNRCGGAGAALVTLYVVQEKKAGKAVAVGVAIPEKDSDSKIECIVKAMKDAKLPTPGSYVAKVSFKL